MDVKEVRRRVAEVEANRLDFEAAHSLEYNLWEDVLRAIAKNDCHDTDELAAEALKTKAIKFHRVCA